MRLQGNTVHMSNPAAMLLGRASQVLNCTWFTCGLSQNSDWFSWSVEELEIQHL